jgi:glycosyltransferase involved in cell wall biosynthesis
MVSKSMITSPSQKISLIIAVFNGAKTLQQCLDSVVSQSYSNVELIIIDGGSTDGTVDLIKENQESISYWISEPDLGIYNAWNKGLEKATGDWICFLGADDYFWNDRVLAQMANSLKVLPNDVRVAYGQIMLINQDGLDLYAVGDPWEEVRNRFKQVMCIPHPGLMHHRSLFRVHGRFDESFRIAGDYELLLRELKSADAVFVPDLILTGMRQGGISSNPKNSIKTLLEARRAQRMHGQKLPGWIWMSAILRVYLRLILWKVLSESAAKKALDIARNWSGKHSYWTKL